MTGPLLRDGFRLAVHDAGGPGEAVIFQHGLCGDARQTDEAFPADPRFRLVTLECRGHGGSDFDPAPSLDAFAGDLQELVEGFGRPVALGGISMGAALALRVAVARPDLVSRLILVRPAWDATPHPPPTLAPNAEVGLLLYRFPAAEARDAFLSSDTAATLRHASPDNLASLAGFFSRDPVSRTAILLSALSRDPLGILPAQLAALRMPILVCRTEEDAIHPADLAASLAAALPGARLVDLPPKGRDRAAHIAALHNAITDFLTETRP